MWTKTTDMRFDQRPGRAATENYATTMDSSMRVNFQVCFFLFVCGFLYIYMKQEKGPVAYKELQEPGPGYTGHQRITSMMADLRITQNEAYQNLLQKFDRFLEKVKLRLK